MLIFNNYEIWIRMNFSCENFTCALGDFRLYSEKSKISEFSKKIFIMRFSATKEAWAAILGLRFAFKQKNSFRGRKSSFRGQIAVLKFV